MVQVQSLRPNKAENEPFSALFFAFSGQNRAFSHHFHTTRNLQNFLTTCLTTVGAGAIHLVASASVRSAQKTKFKRFPEVFPPRTFSLFTAYQFSVAPYNDLPADLVALLADPFQFQNHLNQEFFFA